jgi:large subunit ribosomal protein L6
VTRCGRTITVVGKLGQLSYTLPEGIELVQDGKTISFTRNSDRPPVRALHGLARAIVNNHVLGVSQGFTRTLEVVGTGYRVAADKHKVTLTVGYSHPVVIALPPEVSVEVKGPTVTVRGADKEKVGHYASLIRKARPPEPYKGKGVRYSEEKVRIKAGKRAKSV